jgi:hypothetical protein
MANRSYLYTYHPNTESKYRDISEWNTSIPVSHLLLVGANPQVCESAIWEVDRPIAIEGEAPESRTLFLEFLDWLAPQFESSEFDGAVAATRQILERPDRQGTHYHLEPGEIYELAGLDLETMESTTVSYAGLARNLYAEVERVISTPSSTVDNLNHSFLKSIASDWESELGLYFTHVLYFHLGG